MSFSQDINPEWKFVAIGRGSFATVSIFSGRPVAFKHVIFNSRTPELKTEFETLRALYNFCNTDSFFAIPRPLAYYDPELSSSFVSPEGSPVSNWRSRARRSLVTEVDFKALKLDSAAYAMDQVSPSPCPQLSRSAPCSTHLALVKQPSHHSVAYTSARHWTHVPVVFSTLRIFLWMSPGIASCSTLPRATIIQVWMRSLLAWERC